jgi:hypothetical protein
MTPARVINSFACRFLFSTLAGTIAFPGQVGNTLAESSRADDFIAMGQPAAGAQAAALGYHHGSHRAA